MNLSWPIVLWIVADIVGMGMNVYMVDLSIRRRHRLEADDPRRLVTWYDSTQWGFGLLVKVIGLLIAIWAVTLPPQRPIPPDAAWSVRWGREIITWGLLSMMYAMDVRDVILVYFNQRWWLRPRRAKGAD